MGVDGGKLKKLSEKSYKITDKQRNKDLERGSTSTWRFFVYLIPGQIGIWNFCFLTRGENRSTRRKTSHRKGENP